MVRDLLADAIRIVRGENDRTWEHRLDTRDMTTRTIWVLGVRIDIGEDGLWSNGLGGLVATVGIAACLSVESSCLTGSPAGCAVVCHMMHMSIPNEYKRTFFQTYEGI